MNAKLLSKTQVLNWLHFSKTQHPVAEGLKQRATDMCNISLSLGMVLFSTGPNRLLTMPHMPTYVI